MFFGLAMLLLMPCGAPAQIPIDADPRGTIRTRAELQLLLEQYQDVLASPAYSEAAKAAIRQNAARVQDRLDNGDFKVGDRIALDVEGETALPDTVTVETGPMITLPLFGDIPLAGVLRSEIEDHLTRELGRFIRNPVVRAEGLLRVSIQGSVGSPGFYVVPANMLLSEALMVAGGPGTSNLDGLRIERGTERLMEGDDLREAVRQGRTLDQLNLQAGDQIYLPPTSGGIWGRLPMIAGIVGSLSFLLLRFVN
jgi:protein involved in polysaccharide export with SLBB domain